MYFFSKSHVQESPAAADVALELTFDFFAERRDDYDYYADEYDQPINDTFADHDRFDPELLNLEDAKVLTPYKLFMHFFPVNHVESIIVPATNQFLQEKMTLNQFYIYIALLIASTFFEFDHIQDLWNLENQPLKPSGKFDQFGMTYHRFITIAQHLRLSESDDQKEGTSIETLRLFIRQYNINMRENFKPGCYLAFLS